MAMERFTAMMPLACGMATSAPTTRLTIDPTAPTATFIAAANAGPQEREPHRPGSRIHLDSVSACRDAGRDSRTALPACFPDGLKIADSSRNSAAFVPADLLAQPGSFVVDGQIKADDGTYTDYQATVVVADVAPTVSAEPNQTIAAGTPFSLSGVTFSDPGYSTPAASWDYSATIAWGDAQHSPVAGQASDQVCQRGLPTGTAVREATLRFSRAGPTR